MGTMSVDVLILYQGLPVFYRSYSQPKLEDFALTAGFFDAIMSFSELNVGEKLDTISMSDSLFHFYSKQGLTFVYRESRETPIGQLQVTRLLKELASAFLQEMPQAAAWAGHIEKFTSFTPTCDKILQVHPPHRGFPVLFWAFANPVYMTPVLQITPVLPENEESLYELQYYLKKSMAQFGRRRISNLIHRPFLLYLPRAKRIAYIVAFHLGQRTSPVTYLLCYVAEERDWFAFYQLRSLFSKRVRVIVPELANYLQTLENNPLADDIWRNRDRL